MSSPGRGARGGLTATSVPSKDGTEMAILFWARCPGMPQAGDPGEPRPVYYVGSERVSDSSGDHDRVFCYALADSGYLMRLPLTEAMPLVAADAPPAVGPEPEP